jgi:acyl-CoA thioester hydrolase
VSESPNPSPGASAKAARPRVGDYRYFAPIITRWMDNDAYGHVNNVAYYSYFDSAVNLFLVREGGLDIERSDVIDLVVESKCHYHAAVSYPESLRVGVRVDKLGQRSVVWGLALFREEDELASAHGYIVHVFVDRLSRKPVPMPSTIRSAL